MSTDERGRLPRTIGIFHMNQVGDLVFSLPALAALLALPHNRHEQLFEDKTRSVSPGLVHRAEEYMRANLGEPLTVSDLLDLCECSRTTLFSAFRNTRGYSPTEFLTEQRLQEATR